jgi:hydrogenase maturation protein HypF
MDTVLSKITIRGIVQGVGFRPFVFTLAERFDLHGWVLNNSSGVEIKAEGAADNVSAFVAALRDEAPPLAHIESLEAQPGPPEGYEGFEIRHSERQEGRYALISPDVATCRDCLRELLDPANRRYRYPFINCTNCGPRFTIIADIPYDRPSTTMRVFQMCPDCQREYDDPRDRRFHAQPNACPVCGPQVELVSSDDGRRTTNASRNTQYAADALARAADLLRSGKILAIKGLGGFHLACDATAAQAVQTLRTRKRRPDKPFAVMMVTLDEVREHCVVSPEEEALLTSPQCPIVLLPWRESSDVVREVAPANRYLGVMLPYTPLHHVLLRDAGRPLVMTSGNLTEEPIAAENDEALERLAHLADHFLLHNRDIYARYDDSVWFVPSIPSAEAVPAVYRYQKRSGDDVAPVGCHSEEQSDDDVAPVDCHSEERSDEESPGTEKPIVHSRDSSLPPVAQNDRITQPIRRARGYAPFPIKLPFKTGQILACGAEMKNTFCLTRDDFAFLSQHIGDMGNLDTLEHYTRTVDLYKHLFRIEPKIIAYDLHPDYLATKYAKQQQTTGKTQHATRAGRQSDIQYVSVQHHHAHLAACLADNDWHVQDGLVIGAMLDGTGLGTDGHIWGGEWLVGDYRGFRRAAHLEYLPLPGGDAATRAPWRIAYSYLHTLLRDVPDGTIPPDVSHAEISLLSQQLERGLNCPLTSSMGRLFDAVSALLGICSRTSYEAQAAIELEMKASSQVGTWEPGNWGLEIGATTAPYPFALRSDGDQQIVTLKELFGALLYEVESGTPVATIARRFHETVARMTVDVSQRIAAGTGLHTVALSGGCFQNRLLLALTVPALRQAGFRVLLHRQAPCNDGGLSLGQAAIAHFATQKT